MPRGGTRSGRAAARSGRPRTRPPRAPARTRPSMSGIGIGSSVPKCSVSAGDPRVELLRVTSWLCWLAQAPTWAARGREAKYASDSARGSRSARPRTATCRCIPCHGNSSAALRVRGEVAALARSVVGEEAEPAGVDDLDQHHPDRGMPPAVHRGQCGRVRLGQPELDGLGQPGAEQLQRRRRDGVHLEPLDGGAQVLDPLARGLARPWPQYRPPPRRAATRHGLGRRGCGQQDHRAGIGENGARPGPPTAQE